jgi:hypothetical protein
VGSARRRRFGILAFALLAGCASLESPEGPPLPPDLATRPDGRTGRSWPTDLAEQEARSRIARLINPSVKDREGWSADLHAAYAALEIPHSTETYCAAIAIIEQESSFQVDPVVAGLPDIVRREIDQRADRYGVPKFLVAAALKTKSPTGKTYDQRIDALRTEKQLNALFEDMAGELPLGRQLLADYNPVHTAGPMQVSIAFAEEHTRDKRYPWPIGDTLRNEVFTRRGGLYFGVAILLDYPAPYDQAVYRFADFNAGRYASRNAAFQAALARASRKPVTLDGDLLRYKDGDAIAEPSQVETVLRSLAPSLRLSEREIRRDLLLEKSPAFGDSAVYQRLFELADRAAGKALPRQAMPTIKLNSPKIVRKLTTEWFAKRVEDRYRNCLARG